MSRSLFAPLRFECSFRIPHVDRDASGLTLHPDTGHLWVVIDEPERLVEFTDEGEFVNGLVVVVEPRIARGRGV